ncbi:hypothetical protein CFC21_069763 [Triticum aestivum]|uniref:Serine protease n=2 Tax=Triticum aestivum TaxID=4565 RepID=A0A9R1HD30_WHEAT|nr:uncharacterized protein LOC123115530 [Triticum aestivum]KAF7063238.1 hypothetical protein CFC21_069763 [Triticum aestivum]
MAAHPPAPAALPTMPMIDWRPLHAAARPSVFIIVLTPRLKKTLRRVADTYGIKEEKELDEIFKADYLTETGIAVRTVGDFLFITTTAHIVDFLFQAQWGPISAAQFNDYFEIAVTCSHAESRFIQGGFVGERTYTRATVCAIDCAKDLMMVRVDLRDLAVRTSGELQQRIRCTSDHPAVQFSMATNAGTQCMLYSWPAYRPCTMATGLQGLHRGPLDLMSTNKNGYDLQLIEASVGTEAGSSGAPLYNTNQQVLGILHGGSGVHSQFIPARYIWTFINNNCLLPKPRGPQDQGKPSQRPGPPPRDRDKR